MKTDWIGTAKCPGFRYFVDTDNRSLFVVDIFSLYERVIMKEKT